MREQIKQVGFLTLDVTFDVDTLPASVPSAIPFEDAAPVCIEAHLNLVLPGTDTLHTRRLVEITSHYGGMGRHRIVGTYHAFTGGSLDVTRVQLPNLSRPNGRLRVSYAPDIRDLDWIVEHWNPMTASDYQASEWWQAYREQIIQKADPTVAAMLDKAFSGKKL